MKAVSAPILRRFGFRRILLANALITGLITMVPALFRPSTPGLLIIAVLVSSGFLRAVQFTAINVLAYADLDSRQMSGGTAISSVAQQISMSLGVAFGATVLHVVTRMSGADVLTVSDFIPTFVIIGLLPMLSIAVFRRLDPRAGAEMSGHRDPGGR